MLEYYKARLLKAGAGIDKEFLLWIRTICSPNGISSDQECITEIIELVTAYKEVKAEGVIS